MVMIFVSIIFTQDEYRWLDKKSVETVNDINIVIIIIILEVAVIVVVFTRRE